MNKTGKKFGAALLLATTSLVAAGAAQGTVISETEEFLLSTSGADDAGGAFMNMTPLTFDKFDPTLGTLTGIKITLDSFFSGSLDVDGGGFFDNEGDVSLDVSGKVDASASVDILLPLVGVSQFNKSDGTSDGCNDGTTDGPDDLRCSGFGETWSSDFDDVLNVGAIDFGLFTGAGSTFDVKLLLELVFSCETNGDICSAGGDARWGLPEDSGTLTVDYTFREPTGIPEPASLALFGAGLLGLGFARRRRKLT